MTADPYDLDTPTLGELVTARAMVRDWVMGGGNSYGVPLRQIAYLVRYARDVAGDAA